MMPTHLLLARRIRDEIIQLERNVQRVQRAWEAANHAANDADLFVDSAALNLHGFYSGIEHVLEFASYQLEGGPPQGPAWHKELLRQISTDLPNIRPPILTAATVDALDEFRRFRHVIRHVYAEDLQPEKVEALVEQLSAVWQQVKTELETFAQFLEGVSQADDLM